MTEWQQRVVGEKRELDDRLEKLLNFIEASNQPDIFGTLSEAEQSRLRIQYSVMRVYSDVLGERIANFDSEHGQ